MPQWTVYLEGAPSSLRLLAAMAVGVTEEEGAFVLRSQNLNCLIDSSEVERRADELIQTLNGCGRMADDDFAAISSSLIVGDDGGNTIVLTRPATTPMRGGTAVVQQRSSDGVSTRFTALAQVANRDVRVARVLQTLAHGTDPVNLYRVFELVRNDVGRSGMVKRGWTTDPEIRRFTHTVDSVTVRYSGIKPGMQFSAHNRPSTPCRSQKPVPLFGASSRNGPRQRPRDRVRLRPVAGMSA